MHFRPTLKSHRQSVSSDFGLLKTPEGIIVVGCFVVLAIAETLVLYGGYSTVSDRLDQCVIDDTIPEGQSLSGIIFMYLAFIYVMWLAAPKGFGTILSKGTRDTEKNGSMGVAVEGKKNKRLKALKKNKGLKSRPGTRLKSCRLQCSTCRFDEICQYMQPQGTWVSITWLRHRLDRMGRKALDHMLNVGWLDTSPCGGYCRAYPDEETASRGSVPNMVGECLEWHCPLPPAESNLIEDFVEVDEPVEGSSGPESDWELYDCSL